MPKARPKIRLTGAYDDLFSIFARSETRGRPARRAGPLRHLIEAACNLIGLWMGRSNKLLPRYWSMFAQNRLWIEIASPLHHPFDPAVPQLEEARRHLARIERETGRPAAVLCLMSHPRLEDGVALNVEMSRHILLALNSLRPAPCRPRLLVAMDHFALDMLNVAGEGIYAGYMTSCHLALDRQSRLRSWLSRDILRGSAWETIAWRLSRTLSERREAGMVLAGGLPQTTRAIYAVREHVNRMHRTRKTRLDPGKVLAKLARADSDFKKFLAEGPVGDALRRSAWRMMEAWVLARCVHEWPPEASTPPQEAPTYTGRVPSALRDCLQACADALGYSREEFEAGFRSFEEEFKRDTPYRERFFGFLARRVVARGTPLLLLPLTHVPVAGSGEPVNPSDMEEKPAWGHPVLIVRADRNSVTTRASADGNEETLPIGRFAEAFVQTNFN